MLKTMDGDISLNTSRNNARCTVCDKPKNSLRARKSKIMPETTLMLCGECFEGKKEPRWMIIVAAMRYGRGAVIDYIVNHRYVGDEITLKEIMNKVDLG